MPRTGCCPKPPPAGKAVSHHGSAEPMSYKSARGAQASNRGKRGDEWEGEVAAARQAGRTQDAAAPGQPPREERAHGREGGLRWPTDGGAPGAEAQGRGRRTDEWESKAAAGWAHTRPRRAPPRKEGAAPRERMVSRLAPPPRAGAYGLECAAAHCVAFQQKSARSS